MQQKRLKTAEKIVVQLAFRCCKHLKAGQNTQQATSTVLIYITYANILIYIDYDYLMSIVPYNFSPFQFIMHTPLADLFSCS